MKKSTVQVVNEFVTLVGGTTWIKTATACRGDYRGTYDYAILIDGRQRLFVTNGMSGFEERIRDWIGIIRTFRTKKEDYLQVIRQQAVCDNRTAKEEGLKTIQVLDIGILSPEADDGYDFFQPYVLLEVGDRQHKFTETGFAYAIRQDRIEKWVQDCERRLFTAGGVVNPDFIFGNVRFDSTNGMYRIRCQSE